jgi:hypothetical protein
MHKSGKKIHQEVVSTIEIYTAGFCFFENIQVHEFIYMI